MSLGLSSSMSLSCLLLMIKGLHFCSWWIPITHQVYVAICKITTQISIAGGSFLVTFGKTIVVTDWSEIKYFYSKIYNCMLSIISAENISRNTKDFACTAVSDCLLSWMVRRQSQLNLVEVLCYHQEVLVFWSIAWEGPEVKDSHIWQQFRRYILSEQTQTSNRCIDTDIL